jgi:hypothetical protein
MIELGAVPCKQQTSHPETLPKHCLQVFKPVNSNFSEVLRKAAAHFSSKKFPLQMEWVQDAAKANLPFANAVGKVEGCCA